MLLKRITKAPVLIFLLLLSCHDQDDAKISQYDYLFIPNAWYMIADDTSELHLAVFRTDSDGNREDVSTKTIFYHNGKELESNVFTTLVTGEHRFKAVHSEWTSQEEIIISRPPKDYPLISIPVVFHVLYNNEPIGTGSNFSSDTITKFIQEVNSRYRNTYYKFLNQNIIRSPNHVDTQIEFRLATYAPDGSILEEPGIVRYGGIDATKWGNDYQLENHYLHLAEVMWPPDQYINISVLNRDSNPVASGITSPSNHPLCLTEVISDTESWEEYKIRKENTGINSVSLGVLLTMGTLNAGVTTHELGHILGLSHTFTQATDCDTKNQPFGTYDCLEDTQFYNRNYLLQIATRFMGYRDCASDKLVLHDNYMDGTTSQISLFQDNNFKEYFGFTYDQRDRMREILEYSPWIKELKNSAK